MCALCYQNKVKAFLDYSWQEDSEIEFVNLLNQNRGNMLRNSSSSVSTRDYLRRMNEANGKRLSLTTSDLFLNCFEGLLKEEETPDKGWFAQQGGVLKP